MAKKAETIPQQDNPVTALPKARAKSNILEALGLLFGGIKPTHKANIAPMTEAAPVPNLVAPTSLAGKKAPLIKTPATSIPVVELKSKVAINSMTEATPTPKLTAPIPPAGKKASLTRSQ